MRARRKGTDNPYTEIDKIQLKDSDILFKAENIEFDVLPEDYHVKSESDKHWQEIREYASIRAMQGILSNSNNTVYSDLVDSIAEISVACADALIKKLKESN